MTSQGGRAVRVHHRRHARVSSHVFVWHSQTPLALACTTRWSSERSGAPACARAVCTRARERTRKTAVPDCFEGGEGVGGREVAPFSGNAGVGAGAHLPLEDRHRRCAAARRAAPSVSAAPRRHRRSAARCVQPLAKPPPAPCRRPPSPAPGITHAHPPTICPHAHTPPSAASPRTPCPRASRPGGRTRRSPQPPTPTPPARAHARGTNSTARSVPRAGPRAHDRAHARSSEAVQRP